MNLSPPKYRGTLSIAASFAATLGLVAYALLSGPALAKTANEADLLDPEVAFKVSARLKDPKTIEVRYTIAPGYYMYRERFKFDVEGATAAAPQIPHGTKKFDATFNKVMETHRTEVALTIPLKAAAAGSLQLKATSQGCADAGVCYPPLLQQVRLEPGSTAAVTPQSAPSASPANSPLLSKAPAVSSSTVLAQAKPAPAGPGAATPKAGELFVRVSSVDEAEQKVKSAGRVALLDFYADWCAPCKQMEKATLSDKRVKAKLAQFTALQADVTRNTLDDKLLLKRYKLVGPPGIVFFDKNGNEMPHLRVVGFETPDKFLQSLDRALRAQ